jgi:dephospho-CoA kinase
MIRVGVTGGIGAGKSMVCQLLEVMDIPVFYADVVGKQVLDEEPVRTKVLERFNVAVDSEGKVPRQQLADIVFSSKKALADLNALIHPTVRERFGIWCKEHTESPIVAQEAAVLIESGGYRAMDHLVVVTAPEEVRLARVMTRDGIAAERVNARIKEQMGENERLAYADSIIVNDGKTMLIPQVLQLVAALKLVSDPDADRPSN